ncbi:enolase [Patescibacteria group bacterium]
MPKIEEIKAHKIVNSRGTWTVDTRITLSDGMFVEQPVPGGASRGENEAVYLPVEKSIDVISTVINDALHGLDPTNQKEIDSILLEMDGTKNKENLGGNSILSVSLGLARISAMYQKKELFEYISELYGKRIEKNKDLKFPTPVFNILNGGKHAQNNLSFQEFMVIPAPNKPFLQQMEMGVNMYIKLKDNLIKEKHSTGVGDEGGFSPEGFTTKKALDFIKKAADSMYKVGEDVFLGMDVAAESFIEHHKYKISEEDLEMNVTEFTEYYDKIISEYPLIYIEDPFYERDYDGWDMFFKKFSKRLMVVADDLVVTNPIYLKKAIDMKLANAVIVKPNQVGTLTETLDFIRMAKGNNMQIIVSHRSGDTAEDSFIADLALAVEAEFLKSGAPARGERVVKYNRLLDIYSEISGNGNGS